MNIIKAPSAFYMAAGRGAAAYPLLAFDRALKYAEVSDLNLIKVTSVLPANCSRMDYVPILPAGRISPAVMSKCETSVCKTTVSAAIAVAIPKDPNKSGVFFEESGIMELSVAIERASNMCRQAMKDRGTEVLDVTSVGASNTCTFEPVAVLAVALFLWAEEIDQTEEIDNEIK